MQWTSVSFDEMGVMQIVLGIFETSVFAPSEEFGEMKPWHIRRHVGASVQA